MPLLLLMLGPDRAGRAQPPARVDGDSGEHSPGCLAPHGLGDAGQGDAEVSALCGGERVEYEAAHLRDMSGRAVDHLLPTDDEIPGVSSVFYDGVAEVWVDDIADAARWFTSDTHTTTVAPDEERFIDRSLTRFLYSTETPIFG
ncbi:EthD domain-containing protein [Nocardia pseudobrasiliensis]|uniref:EthD domain-containing protein n=1 Tax=Nocardia pseudobrasiliensis TaxID=45979 RepID=A0A370ICN4_9NOCA|nr:EthD domain-containing protein [Nocardia pseudobrasiliensis]RDI68495.1 EthD domain-containing protein [Nocardia pseudobrasiliensis]